MAQAVVQQAEHRRQIQRSIAQSRKKKGEKEQQKKKSSSTEIPPIAKVAMYDGRIKKARQDVSSCSMRPGEKEVLARARCCRCLGDVDDIG